MLEGLQKNQSRGMDTAKNRGNNSIEGTVVIDRQRIRDKYYLTVSVNTLVDKKRQENNAAHPVVHGLSLIT